MPAQPRDHLVHPLDRDHLGLDRLAAGRHLVEAADIHLAILSERQRTRDRRRGHDEHVRRVLALGRQHQPLGDAEAVLLVDHDKAELLVGHRLLEDRVGADQDVDRSVGEAHQRRFAGLALLATGQDRDIEAERRQLPLERREMLAGEDLGRCQHRTLCARLHCREQRHRRHQCLARADIALEQAQHRSLLRHVAFDLADRTGLCPRRRIRQLQLRPQPPVTRQCPALTPPRRGTDQHQCQLVRIDLVIGEPLARLGVGGIAVRALQRVHEGRPTARG